MTIEILTIRRFMKGKFCLLILAFNYKRGMVCFCNYQKHAHCYGQNLFKFDAGYMDERRQNGMKLELYGHEWSVYGKEIR